MGSSVRVDSAPQWRGVIPMTTELPTECTATMDASVASVRRASTRLVAGLGGFDVDAIGYRNRIGQATSA